MELSLRKIGNSKGLIIPSNLLKETGIKDRINVRIEDNALIIEARKQPREGWEDAIKRLGAPEPIRADFPNIFDDEDWTW